MKNTVKSGTETEKIKFFKKYERFFYFAKLLYFILFYFNILFWLIYIPIKDKNPTPVIGLIIFFTFFVFSIGVENDKISKIISLFGVLIFIYSYFLILPFITLEQEDSFCSFITNNRGELINYGKNHYFHIPIYNKHFNYEFNQKREINNDRYKNKLIITFRYNFDEIFVEKDHLNNYLVSRKYFDKLVDAKIALLKLNIERYGVPKKLTDLKDVNDLWLQITSIENKF